MTYRTTDAIQRDVARSAVIPRRFDDSTASQKQRSLQNFANTALKVAARFWFLVAVIGQLIFTFYITVLYGRAAVLGDWAVWNKKLARGYVPGDRAGNSMLALHLLLAVIITLGGAIQLVPHVRDRAPRFHRWVGRTYLVTAFVISLGGLYLVWIRGGVVGDTSQHIGISLNALLIMLCAAMTLRYALAYKLDVHRRWALRLFLVASGVWFFRVGLMFWIFVNGGPAGFDPKTFQGPFLTLWAFADYLLPLAVLESYLRAQERGGTTARLAMAAGLFVLTVVMGIGIFVAAMGLWLPHI